jgi:hypothetical protein
LREVPGFVEAEASQDEHRVRLQWARDSAFRFFPLVMEEEIGLTLHPFDLAANKVLALVGRLEARDWVDMISSHQRIQPLGLLAWAACGKDPGYSPAFILEHAARTTHYSQAELDELIFAGQPPDIQQLARTWRQALAEAREMISVLPPAELGRCVLNLNGELFTGTGKELTASLSAGQLRFHPGSIRGALPKLIV